MSATKLSSYLHSGQASRCLRNGWQLRICAALSLLCLASGYIQGQTTSPSINLALNLSRTGFPSPAESDNGWGGGTDKWQIVDGIRGYADTFAHGLAFTGGHQTADGGPPWIEPAGV